MSRESTNYSPMQETFPAVGAEGTNSSKQVEVESENLGKLPIFQEGVKVELGGTEDVQEENSLQLVSGPVCKGTNVEQMREVTGQPTGVDLIKVATGKNKEEVLGVEASGLDKRLEKIGPSSVKPKSTWTRFNRMDFGLGGLSKALQLPTHRKRSSDSTREEELCDHSDFRETKRGKVRDAETKVQTLINSELGVWKSELVQQLFLPQEASIILGIPLSSHCPPDKVAWAYTPSGAFSTSNAYKHLASGADGSQAESSNRRLIRFNPLSPRCNIGEHLNQVITKSTLTLLHSAGLGVVIRDWRGEFVGALSAPMSLSQSVADLEALACRKAIEFAAELGLQKVTFEGDLAMVINALNQDNAALSSFSVVIEDIRSQILVFQSFAFNYVGRSCNCVADSLAKKSKRL
nr:hypothetical protein CFP56_68712 [Quercus suber]